MELGPYTLDVLVQQPPPAGGGEGDGDGRPPPMVVIEVDGASHFFQNLLDDAEREKTQPPKQKRTKKGGKAPRGQTALKRRCAYMCDLFYG